MEQILKLTWLWYDKAYIIIDHKNSLGVRKLCVQIFFWKVNIKSVNGCIIVSKTIVPPILKATPVED